MIWCAKQLVLTGSAIFAMTTLGAAQSQNYVAKFNSSGGTVNSSIFDNGNVGIGMVNPAVPLDVVGYFHVSGSQSPSTVGQGAYFSWNALTGGTGETDFINNQGLGLGGFAFMNTPSAGSPKTTLMFLSGAGNLGVGTTSPDGKLNVGGAPNTWTANGWRKGIRLDDIHAIEFGGGEPVKYGIGQSDNILYFFDTTADDASARANYRLVVSNGNVGIGTTSPGTMLEVNGSVKLSSGSGATLTFPDGTTQSTAWTGVLCGGDYAESIDISDDRTQYQPGDVLIIDDDHPGKFLKSSQPYSVSVAGIYSTKPGLVGRRQKNPKTLEEIPMAMIGIVPVKVSAENGPIRPHDLLVSSSTSGYAMKGTDSSKMLGAVIGKALGSLDSGTGVVEVLLNVQ